MVTLALVMPHIGCDALWCQGLAARWLASHDAPCGHFNAHFGSHCTVLCALCLEYPLRCFCLPELGFWLGSLLPKKQKPNAMLCPFTSTSCF